MQPIVSQFSRYVIPSMMSMVMVGMYMIVDGYFLGQAMGDDGLTAINIAWPLLALMTAAGTGLGTGGSIIMTIRRARGDEKGARLAMSTTLWMLLAACILLLPVYYLGVDDLLSLLGARGVIHAYGLDYMLVITYGAVFQVMGAGLLPMIKNMGMPIYAMSMMFAGMVVNIALDAYLMLGIGMGLDGIAYATCIAQAVVAFMALGPILKARLGTTWCRVDKNTALDTLKIGLSPFGLTFSPALVVILTNYLCLYYGGNAAVAVYTVSAYAAYVIYSLMQGLADGVQPLISHCTGAKDGKNLRAVLKKALVLGFGLSAFFMIVFYLTRFSFPVFYGLSHEVALACIPAMVSVAVSAPFVVVARVMSAYFYAMEDSRNASIMVYFDPFVFAPLFLVCLPLIFGVDGIWYAYPATQAALAILAGWLMMLRKRSGCMVQAAAG